MNCELQSCDPTKIGPYTLRARLGEGAMSSVYEGIDPATGDPVAIKVIEADPASDPDAAERFEREARALEKITHPGVARLRGAGRMEDGRLYLVFDLVRGPTLQEVIERADQPEYLTVLCWMIQATDALDEAWKHHIIHRDLKPGNMMVDESGKLRIVDFGLAKAIHADPGITPNRMLLGTPRYMSPEMSLGQSQDFRSDMYSLGATFYHLATGQPPFDAPTPAAMMLKHAQAQLPSPQSVEPKLPHDLAAILTRLLAKDPQRRYSSYFDLASDLREASLALKATVRPHDPTLRLDRPAEQPPLDRRGDPPGSSTLAPSAETSKDLGSTAKTLLALFLIGMGIVTVLHFESKREPGASGDGRSRAFILNLLRGEKGRKIEAEHLEATNRERMAGLMSAIVQYEVARGVAPRRLEDLRTYGIASGQNLFTDPWGNRYEYRLIERTLLSMGADGQAGTEDDYLLNSGMEFIQEPMLEEDSQPSEREQ